MGWSFQSDCRHRAFFCVIGAAAFLYSIFGFRSVYVFVHFSINFYPLGVLKIEALPLRALALPFRRFLSRRHQSMAQEALTFPFVFTIRILQGSLILQRRFLTARSAKTASSVERGRFSKSSFCKLPTAPRRRQLASPCSGKSRYAPWLLFQGVLFPKRHLFS